LVNAHNAGDTVAAKSLANEIIRIGGAEQSAPAAPQAPQDYSDISAAIPDVAVNREQRQYNALPAWGQALVAGQDMLNIGVNGITLGHADKAAAGMDSMLGRGSYEDRLAYHRKMTDDARSRAGSAGVVADVLGTLAPATGLAKSFLSASRAVPATLGGGLGLAARTGAMAADGATLGTVQAWGNDQDAATGAMLGALGGAGGNLLGEGISAGLGKVAGAFNAKPKVMAPEELKAAGSAAYGRAKDAGVVFKPEAVGRLRDTVYKDMAEFGWDPRLQPGAEVVYDRLSRLAEGGNVGLDGLESVRKIAGNAYNPLNNSNNELLRQITQRVDDFAANAGPDDILMGNAKAATDALSEGRGYWARFRKLEKVQELIDRAGRRAGSTGSGGNVENATRQELRKILDNKKMMRGFTPDEINAIEAAVMGTGAQNTLRLLGKLSPQGNGLMAGLGLGGAFAMPQVAVPAMLIGAGAKKGAEAMTRANAEYVKRLIATGGNKASLLGQPNAVQRLAQQYRPLLGRALMSGALVGTAGQ
jgi:hypothetical protein